MDASGEWASVLLVALIHAWVLPPSIRGEALVSSGYQIEFQTHTAYEAWLVDGRPRATVISQDKDLQIFALCDGFL